jgi:3-methyladenine DNA glycosylase AlkD
MLHPLVADVRRRLRGLADPARAKPMQRYMKSSMPFLGVSAPALRAVCRDAMTAHRLDSFDEWFGAVLALWRDAEYREERHAAITIADDTRYASYRTRQAIPMIEEMIVTGAWWDYVDALATHHLGDVLAAERRAGRGAAMRRLLLQWARGDNLWKRRAAMLCQIGFKKDTDVELLFACVEPSLFDAGSKGARPTKDIRHDFFIRKAIGWALRQYAWVHPDEVKRYVAANRVRLSPLSMREALKNIGPEKGTKIAKGPKDGRR